MIELIYISNARHGVGIAQPAVALEAGQGIVGDRYFGKNDYPGQNLTLVEAEEIEAFCTTHGRQIDLSLTRRNLVTRGIRLNDLVGKDFRLGGALLHGVELCEPCSSLGKRLAGGTLTPAAVVKHWVGRGGLRAEVLDSGRVELGDRLEIIRT